MRTLLIVPSFLSLFAAVMLGVALLISFGGQSENNAVPPRHAFTSWYETMPAHRPTPNPSKAAARESVDELAYY